MYTDNDILFPRRSIQHLKNLRGPQWQALVEKVTTLPETHEQTLAFMLMMIRLNGCMGCETDSYRAMRGCTMCAQQTIRRYKEGDADLMAAYEQALADIRAFAAESPQFAIISSTTQTDSVR